MKTWKLLLIASVITFLFIVVFGILLFPSIFKFMVRNQTSLRKRNLIRKYYLKVPVALDFRVNFFNVTNPDEVLQGKTPILEEVGPYCYDAFKEKINTTDDESKDSLTYNPYETYFYNRTRSGSRSPDDEVFILNPLVLAMINTVELKSPGFLGTVAKALKPIFNDPQSIYLRVKVRQILFDGVVVNCTSKNFASKSVCSQLKIQIKSLLVETEPNIFLFSLFGARNGTIPTRFTIIRGIKSSSNLGRLVDIDGQKEQTLWSTQECNQFRGTDGWIFPPFQSKEEGLWSHAHDICKNVHLKYLEDVEYRGIKARRLRATLVDMSSDEDKCYCPAPDKCLPKGVFDLTKCMGGPIYATLPHFLDVDEKLLQQVRGLNPNESKHALEAVLEPTLGTPIIAYKRLQFNLMIKPLAKIPFMTNLSEALHPIFWIEEGIILEGDLLKQITQVFTLLKIIGIIKYIFLVGSIGGMVLSGILWHRYKNSMIIPIDELRKSASSRSSSTDSDSDSQHKINGYRSH